MSPACARHFPVLVLDDRCPRCGHRIGRPGHPARATRTLPPWRWPAEYRARWRARQAMGPLAARQHDRPKLTVALNLHDMWVGLYWKHDVPGWDGGWWEGWQFYLILIPCVVVALDVDRSNLDTRAWRRYVAAGAR